MRINASKRPSISISACLCLMVGIVGVLLLVLAGVGVVLAVLPAAVVGGSAIVELVLWLRRVERKI